MAMANERYVNIHRVSRPRPKLWLNKLQCARVESLISRSQHWNKAVHPYSYLESWRFYLNFNDVQYVQPGWPENEHPYSCVDRAGIKSIVQNWVISKPSKRQFKAVCKKTTGPTSPAGVSTGPTGSRPHTNPTKHMLLSIVYRSR